MQPFSSTVLHGKPAFIENDERTAYGPSEGSDYDYGCGRGTTAVESVGCINREFGMMAATGNMHYWLDHPKGSLYDPALTEVIAEHLKLFRELPDVKGTTPVEAAVVADDESIYYSSDQKSPFTANKGIIPRLNYLGIPYRSLLIKDLLEPGRVPAHKLYIMFPTLVLSRAERAALKQRFEQEKATVLWLYAAGSSYPDKGPRAEFCGDFLGMKFVMKADRFNETLRLESEPLYESMFKGTPYFYPTGGYDRVLGKNRAGETVIAAKKLGHAVHIFSALPDLPKTMLARIIEDAGVFRYTKHLGDPVWIGNDLIFVYIVSGGERKIALPPDMVLKPVIGPLSGTLRGGECFRAEPGLTYGFLVVKK